MSEERGSSVNWASVSYKPVFEHGRRMINGQWLYQHKNKIGKKSVIINKMRERKHSDN